MIPIQAPTSGGEVWVELRPGDYVQGAIEPRLQGDKSMVSLFLWNLESELGSDLGVLMKFVLGKENESC